MFILTNFFNFMGFPEQIFNTPISSSKLIILNIDLHKKFTGTKSLTNSPESLIFLILFFS